MTRKYPKKPIIRERPSKRTQKPYKLVRQLPRISFRPNNKTAKFLNSVYSESINRSKIINKSLELWEEFTTNPEKLMERLKYMYPEKWKYINRRKF
mgnify:CR=1 FL=1